MSIEFRCPQCSQLLRTPDAHVGKQAKCPKCFMTTNVPQKSARPPIISTPIPQVQQSALDGRESVVWPAVRIFIGFWLCGLGLVIPPMVYLCLLRPIKFIFSGACWILSISFVSGSPLTGIMMLMLCSICAWSSIRNHFIQLRINRRLRERIRIYDNAVNGTATGKPFYNRELEQWIMTTEQWLLVDYIREMTVNEIYRFHEDLLDEGFPADRSSIYYHTFTISCKAVTCELQKAEDAGVRLTGYKKLDGLTPTAFVFLATNLLQLMAIGLAESLFVKKAASLMDEIDHQRKN